MFETPLPRWMQYLSLDPITLALGDRTGELEGKEQQESVAQTRKLEEKIKLHSVRQHKTTVKEESLGCIIGQVDSTHPRF